MCMYSQTLKYKYNTGKCKYEYFVKLSSTIIRDFSHFKHFINYICYNDLITSTCLHTIDDKFIFFLRDNNF